MSKTTKKIDESLPKSTRERILRKFRPKVKSPKKARKEPHMKGRIVPKKSGDNDPRRNNPWVGEALDFFLGNVGKKIEDLPLDDYDKEGLFESTNHLIAVSMGGWSKKDGEEEHPVYINESGREAKSINWVLNEDGTLSPQNGATIDLDTEWLHALRSKLWDDLHGSE